MSEPVITLLSNVSQSDGPCLSPLGGVGGAGSDWRVLQPADRLVFASEEQQDDDPASGRYYPPISPASGQREAARLLIRDAAAARYRRVPLAGSSAGGEQGGDTRHVLAVHLDRAVSGPVWLEAWDTLECLTHASAILGGGSAAASWLRAVATTAASPGAAWSGTPLAGAVSRLLLAESLSTAGYLYLNLRLVVPSGLAPATYDGWAISVRAGY